MWMFLSVPKTTSELHPDALCECSFHSKFSSILYQLFVRANSSCITLPISLTTLYFFTPHSTPCIALPTPDITPDIQFQHINIVISLHLSLHHALHYTNHYATLCITLHYTVLQAWHYSSPDIILHTERNTRHITLHNTFLYTTLDTSRHIALHLTLHFYKLWLHCLGCCHSGSRCVVKLCFSDTRSLPTQLPAALGAGVLWSCSSATRIA
jgi:hypothetical protein